MLRSGRLDPRVHHHSARRTLFMRCHRMHAACDPMRPIAASDARQRHRRGDRQQHLSRRGAIRAEATAREFLEALTGVPGPLRWSIARRGEVVLVARSPAATPEPEFDDTPQGTVATLR
eukprot:353707-Chlamydomonas_euryale.AAC.18